MLYRCSIDSPVGCLRLEEEDGYLTGFHLSLIHISEPTRH